MGRRSLTLPDFIERGHKAHGNRYDYSKSTYVRKEHKTTITCSEHGDFLQRPDHHWNGSGCLKCVEDRWGRERRKSTEDFVQDARKVHGSRYDYAQVVCHGRDKKVKIRCAVHGLFEQKPGSHLQGQGCRKCAGTAPLTPAEFVRRAQGIHGTRYLYARTQYVNMSTKVTVTCPKPKHGDFRVRAKNHLYIKNGCPRCRYSKGEHAVAAWLNHMGVGHEPQKSFPSCRYRKPLHFDFYIPKYHALIEYDGELHFHNMRKCPGFSLEAVRIRDGVKDQWCRKQGVPLLRVSYLDKVAPTLRDFFLDLEMSRFDSILEIQGDGRNE